MSGVSRGCWSPTFGVSRRVSWTEIGIDNLVEDDQSHGAAHPQD